MEHSAFLQWSSHDVDILSYVSRDAWDNATCANDVIKFRTLTSDVLRFACDVSFSDNNTRAYHVTDPSIISVDRSANGWLVLFNRTSVSMAPLRQTHIPWVTVIRAFITQNAFLEVFFNFSCFFQVSVILVGALVLIGLIAGFVVVLKRRKPVESNHGFQVVPLTNKRRLLSFVAATHKPPVLAQTQSGHLRTNDVHQRNGDSRGRWRRSQLVWSQFTRR